MIAEVLQDFQTPPVMMRGAPFWAWNGDLREDRLREQIRLMYEMGYGGFFMHSRTGLETPYMQKEWFHAIDVCIEEAEKLGMLAYLYDEDRWPSGAAGGIVTSEDRFKSRKLYCTSGEIPPEGTVVAVFSLLLEKNKIVSMHRLKNGEKSAGNGTVYSFYWKYMDSSTWYNNAAYLNTIDRESVRRFLAVTHEKYAELYGSKFSGSVPAIFTDEPCYIHGDIQSCLPWTSDLCEEFNSRFHYELTDRLPELFFETGSEVSQVRYHYYDLLTEFFSDRFIGQIAEWGRENALPLCGHLLGEDSLSSQTLYIGNAMRCYEKMQIPGVDVLTEYWNIFNTVKQCSSVAHQFGKVNRMTETYGCTGWDFPFYGHKAIGDWQYALGINMRCLHLSWYSMAGEGKRDYPASFLNHSPWYRKYPVLENYFSRLGAVLKHGEEIRDLLVIHPIESLWAVMVKDFSGDEASRAKRQIQPGRKVLDTFDSPIVNQLDQAHTDLTNLLLKENLDFDFGDEEILSRIAAAENLILRVGKAAYRQILIPELKTIRSSTLELLQKFKGNVFYLGEPPLFVDALPSGKAKEIFESFTPVTWENLAETIASDFRRVSITENGNQQAAPILYRLADCGDGYTVFLANTSMTFPADQKKAVMVRDRMISCPETLVTLQLPFKGNVAEFNAVDGTCKPVCYQYRDGAYHIPLSFGRLESRLLIISDQFEQASAVIPAGILENVSIPDCGCDYRLSEENILVLDHAEWQTETASSEGKEYIIPADDKFREMIDEKPRGGLMEQPWHRKKKDCEKSMKLTLRYTFFCDTLPENDCILSVENPEQFTILFNGKRLEQNITGYYLDRDICDLKLEKTLFRSGENQLVFTCSHYDHRTNLEAVYLRGNFGVDMNSHITGLPEKLYFGDWCEQKLANYAGNITYYMDLDLPEDSILKFPDWYGSLLGLQVDDGEETLLPFFPFETEVPSGKHRLAVTVYGHRRNALGPFYLKTKWQERTGPYQFKVYESSQRQLVPCGLVKAPVISRKTR